MKRVSPKRAARNAEVAPWRKQLVCRVGRCECCGRRRGLPLEIHEIARGTSRDDALSEAYAVLVLCWKCHDELHTMSGEGQRAFGLALLIRSRPDNFDLKAFYELTQRRWPYVESIELWCKRLAFVTER